MQVLPVWELAIPLPAVLLIAVTLYMMVLGMVLWIRYCLKDQCSPSCGDCCPYVSVCEHCFTLAEMCDCRPPTLRSWLTSECPSPSCAAWDRPCQTPECDSCNCLCFEIRIK